MATSLLESPLVGAATPRVIVAPPSTHTLGPEAIELCRRAGQVLDPWQCDAINLMLSVRDDGLWACFEYCEWVARQNGKGAILEARALAGFFLLDERLIMWSAHEYKTAMEAFRRVRHLMVQLGREIGPNLIDVDGVLVKVNNTNGEESFERLDTGARIKFIARSKGSGRGFSGDVNIIDEAFAFTPAMLEALMPTMNARENPQIIYMSSPPLDSVSAEPMFDLRKRAEAGGEKAEGLGYRDWGFGGDLGDLQRAKGDAKRIDPDDMTIWAATNPALGSRIRLETLQRNRRSMGSLGFAREILGIWPPAPVEGDGLFDMDVWSDRGDPASRPGKALVFAVDAPPDRRSAAIASAGRREDDLLHAKITDHRPGLHWVVARLVDLVERFEPRAVLIDPSSAAGSLIPELTAAGVEVTTVTARELAQACGAFYDDVIYGRLRHCGQETLTAAVQQATTRPLADAFAWDRKSTSGDIAPLCASTLALYGFRVHGEKEVEPWVIVG